MLSSPLSFKCPGTTPTARYSLTTGVGIAQFGAGYTGIPSDMNRGQFYVYLPGRTDGKQATSKDESAPPEASTRFW